MISPNFFLKTNCFYNFHPYNVFINRVSLHVRLLPAAPRGARGTLTRHFFM